LADEFATLGPNGTRRLESRGIQPNRITELPPTIDLGRFDTEVGNKIQVPAGRSVLLFVGRLTRLKGRETFERTIPKILESRHDFQFVFVGEVANCLKIPDRYRDYVNVVGEVQPEELAGFYSQADLLVHPTLTEGVPRVLLEALASGTPVVARDVGDVRTVTDNTFLTEDEFVNMVVDFESLSVDEVTPFSRASLRPAYREFFESLRRK
jgi:glycosyltransferase involved in cell wall biosynthesis